MTHFGYLATRLTDHLNMFFLKTNGFLDVQFSINPVCSEAHIQNAQMDEGGMCTTLKHEHTTLG